MTIPFASLRRQLQKDNLDALLFSTSEALTSTNLKFVTGFTGSEATVLLTRSESHLFTDGRYKTQAKQECPSFVVHVVRNRADALTRFFRLLDLRRIGVESSRLSYEFVTSLCAKVPGLQVVPLKRQVLENLRIRKSPEERLLIKKAAAVASKACAEIIEEGIEGKKECEVAAELESLFRRRGADGIAFETIVAAGERSALPHASPSERMIGHGELVIIDYGCRIRGYHSDETVTCVTGRPTDEQKRIHQAVYEAHNRALDATRAGMKVRELDGVARRTIEKAGLGKFFLHGLGHGVGLEIHEPPRLSPRGTGLLREGMVFTIEPGVYVEGFGGVRLESLVFLSKTGPEILSEMPKELISAG